MTCLACETPLDGPATRVSYDPWLGRLWRVCPRCRRWNVVPMEDRWDALERYERATRDRGRSVLRTPNLDLVATPQGQLIRVGRAPRPELASWRYGDTAPPPPASGLRSAVARLIAGLPSSPFGYDAGYGRLLGDTTVSDRWLASPFLDEAPTLTAAFLHVPLAPTCPACAAPLALAPWSFQRVRLVADPSGPAVAAPCGVCRREVGVALAEARPALRLGLGIVTRRLRDRAVAEAGAERVEAAGGAEPLVWRLAEDAVPVGELDGEDRLALVMALDEQAEAELLEREWREAEEMAAIVDGELTEPAGFQDFRRRVLSGG